MRSQFFNLMIALALPCISHSLSAQNAPAGQPQVITNAAIIEKLKTNGFRDELSMLAALAEAHQSRLGLELRTELRSFAKRNPGTKTALTAELWLAVTELRFANSKSVTRRNEKVAEARQTLSAIAAGNAGTWHAKAARFGTVACLMAAKEWAAFEEEANGILGSIASFTNPKDEELRLFFGSLGLNSSEIECEVFASLMMVASSHGEFAKALAHAETLQNRFPEWSEKNAIAQVVQRLKKNESPYSLK